VRTCVLSIKFVKRHNGNRSKISVAGHERSPGTWRLDKMGIPFEALPTTSQTGWSPPLLKICTKTKKAGFIMANPLFSIKLYGQAAHLCQTPNMRGSAYAL
jgi:type I restriction enzyme M protein